MAFDNPLDRTSLIFPTDEPESDTALDLSRADTPTLLPAEAQKRAETYSFATKIPTTQIYQQLLAGDEEYLRNQAARETERQNNDARLGILQEYAEVRNAALAAAGADPDAHPLSETELDTLVGLTVPQMTNPDTVLEELFAKEAIKALFPQDGVRGQAAQENPYVLHSIQDATEEQIALNEYAKRLLDDLENEQKQKGIFGHVTDFTGQMMPFLSQWNQYNAINRKEPGPIGTSANLEAQYAHIRLLPFDQAVETLRAGYDNLRSKNALDAANFLHGFLNHGSTAAFLESSINVADASIVVSPLMKIAGRGVMAGIRGGVQRVKDVREINGFIARVNKQFETDLAELNLILKEEGLTKAAPEYQAELATLIKRRDAELAELKLIWEEHLAGLDKNVQFAKGAQDVVADLAVGKGTISSASAAAGRNDIYAADAAYQESLNALRAADPSHASARLIADLPTLADPASVFAGPAPKLARRFAENITDKLETLSTDFFAAARGLLPSYLSPKAMLQALESTRIALLEDFKRAGLADSVLDASKVYMPDQTVSGLGFVSAKMGRPDGTFFENMDQLRYWAKEYGLEGTIHDATGTVGKVLATENLKNVAVGRAKKLDGEVVQVGKKYQIIAKQQGTGYYLEVVRPARETFDEVKDALIETGNVTPKSAFNTFLDGFGLTKFRTPNERLSPEQQGLRELVIQRQTAISKLVGRSLDLAKSMTKAERRNMDRFWDNMRRFQTVDANGVPRSGIEFATQTEFETAYTNWLGHVPSARQSAAYWGYIQAYNLELFLNNLYTYAGKARVGTMLWQLEKDGDFREGILVKAPVWRGDANVMVMAPDGNKVYQGSIFAKDAVKQAEVKDLIDNHGYQVIWQTNPKGLSGVDVHYVVARPTRNKNITMDQIPKAPAGHMGYDYTGYVKQAVLGRHPGSGYIYHYGDNTVFPVMSESEGRARIAALEQARLIYNSGNRAAFDTFVSTRLPMAPQVLYNKFAAGSAKGGLDADVPFLYARSGEGTFHTPEMQKFLSGSDVAVEWSKSDLNPLKDLSREYQGLRGWGVHQAVNISDERSPMFQLVKPRLVDPLPMIVQSLGKAARNGLLERYKIRSAEHFIEEFAPVLKGGNDPNVLREMRMNPMGVLADPPFDLSTADRTKLAQARSYQEATKTLIGTSTDSGKYFQYAKAWLMDRTFERYGVKGSEFVADNILPFIPDPIKAMRAGAFHLKLGLFVPVQLWLQAQTFTVAVGIAGLRSGSAGIAGATLAGFAHLMPKHLDYIAGLAGKMGWKPAEFKEAYQAMMRSGVMNIGPQHAWKDAAVEPNIFRTGGKAMLDKGLLFFNGGERTNHTVAYMAAFHSWRKANPTARFDEAAATTVYRRYSDMTVNMTHASSSALNRGPLAVMGQFFSYQERLTELMLGHRLTPAEKLRVFGVLSAMYGVPTSIGALTFGMEQPVTQGLSALGVPIPGGLAVGSAYEDLRAEGLKRGITNNSYWEAMMEGLPELMLHVALGEQYNLSQRLGPGGPGALWDDVNSGPVAKIFMGAGGNVLGDVARSTYPLLGDAMDILTGKGIPPTTVTDIQSWLANAAVVSAGMKMYYGLNLGTYFSKSHQIVDDQITGQEAIMMGLFGLTPARITDSMIMKNAVDAEVQAKSFARSEAQKYLRIYWQTVGEDVSTAESYRKKAFDILNVSGFNEREKIDLMSQVLHETKTSVEQSQRAFQRKFLQPEFTE